MWKLLALVAASVLLATSAPAAEHYVSASLGDDANPGTIASPFRTIGRAASVMNAGDQCFIRAGVYRETVIPAADGLRFSAHNAEAVTISGCDLVAGPWEVHSGEILKADVSSTVSQLFIDDRRMNLARYPDEVPERDMLGKDSWTPTLTSSPELGVGVVEFHEMPDMPADHWVGAYYTGSNGPNPFAAARGKVVSSQDNTVTLSDLSFYWRIDQEAVSAVGDGSGHLMNHLNALTAPTEWYWAGGILYVYPPGDVALADSAVEARTRLWGFDLTGRSSVVVEGLRFHAASLKLEDARNCEILDCEIFYPAPWSDYDHPSPQSGERLGLDYGGPDDGSCGVYVTGSNNRVARCHIAHSWGAGIRLDGEDNTLEECLIEDANWFARRIGGIQLLGERNTVARNTIRRTAQAGIDGGNRTLGFGIVGKRFDVLQNLVMDAGLLTADTGLYYTNNQNIPELLEGEIAYNTFLRIFGFNHPFAVYIDNGTNGVDIHHNVVYGGPECDTGIFLHNQRAQTDINVFNNTVMGAQNWSIRCGTRGTTTTDVVFRNNLCDMPTNGASDESHNTTDAVSGDFIHAAGFDYRLAETSSAIDAGVEIPGITDGYAGVAPDRGAYEYSVPTDVPPLPPAISCSATTPSEGDGVVNIDAFAVSIPACPVPIPIEYRVTTGTAVPGEDFVTTEGVLVFMPGETSKRVPVTLLGDTVEEPSKRFTLSCVHPFTKAVSTCEGVIEDDDFPGFDAFGYEMRILFDNFDGRGPLTDFPFLVRLGPDAPTTLSTETAFSYDQFESPDGYDLRFSDDVRSTLLNFEVEEWDTNGVSLVWVQVPRLEHLGAIRAHWGCDDPSVTTAPPAYALDGSTWSEDFEGVWHMGEIDAQDASPHGRHGLAYDDDAPTTGDEVATTPGLIGDALAFAWDDAKVTVPGFKGVLGETSRTCTAWVRATDTAGGFLFWGEDAPGARWFFGAQDNHGDPRTLGAKVHSGYRVGTATIDDGAWRHVAAVLGHDGDPNTADIRLFVDGLEDSISATLDEPIDTQPNYDLDIGGGLVGAMDETRLARVPRSADWIWAEWMNQGPNHDAFAEYENVTIQTYTLNYIAGPGGAIVGHSPQTVSYHEDGSPVRAVADPKHWFVRWSDGVTDNPRTDTDVGGNIDATALFGGPDISGARVWFFY